VDTGPDEAAITADVLIDADLRGLETHGSRRIPDYLKAAKRKLLQPANKPFVEWQKKAVSLVDGNNGWGQPSVVMAVHEVIKNAGLHGVGAAGVKNTNHIGTCAYYARLLAQKGLIGFVTTNTAPNLPPWGGSEAILGTNPICFSAPAPDGKIIVLDMATTVVAKGKIMLAAEKGETIPAGWALDKNGRSTTDPRAVMEGGLMLPLGGPKGSGLALFTDIFCGVLSGANFGKNVHTMLGTNTITAGVGAFVWAIEIDLFGEADFYSRMAALISMVTGATLAEGFDKIFLPGEIEDDKARDRLVNGIPISEPLLNNLNQLALELDVPPLK
jgi:LDH2 family malate/lactate/ureidoglycolate dehydrogenase